MTDRIGAAAAPDETTIFVCDSCGEPAHPVYDSEKLGEQGAYDIVCDSCGWEFFVPAEATARSRIAKVRQIANGNAARIDGYLVDRFTASMLLTVYNALSNESKAKFGKPSLPTLVDFGWKHVR